MQAPQIFIVIPAFNEAQAIRQVVLGVLPYADKVVVVDDGSSDQTALQAQAAGAVVLQHVVNRGYGAALVTGTAYAVARGADVIVHFDADGQHDPADVGRLVKTLAVGVPSVALGSRTLGSSLGQPLLRRLLLWLARYFTWAHTGILLSDAHNGLRAYTREAWERFQFTQDRMAFSSEVVSELARTNTPWLEVPVHVRYTAGSLKGSKQGKLGALKIVWDLVLGRLVK